MVDPRLVAGEDRRSLAAAPRPPSDAATALGAAEVAIAANRRRRRLADTLAVPSRS
ncbi:hypothetical protein [Nitriliruptor alkaliphilus]|uniref:hypothetical protein n=1 Tax=Nitriliruptor alkaliphilus TaxID=427918 RepID=UPI00147078BA|nr:hypothetical protein [Nitriliruptor alkaliphilus]